MQGLSKLDFDQINCFVRACEPFPKSKEKQTDKRKEKINKYKTRTHTLTQGVTYRKEIEKCIKM